MPHLTTDDGVKLYYEEIGAGIPIIFVHEFAGDHRSYEMQMRYFGQRYRCVAFNARGYPPSDVPQEGERYSQARARDDIRAVLDALNIDKAHIVGLSMGGFAAPSFWLYLSAAGTLSCGRRVRLRSGAGQASAVRGGSGSRGRAIRKQTMVKAAKGYALGPTRVQFQNKDPRGWKEFADQLAQHSTEGSARTMRGVQARRPSLFDLVDDMKQLTVPALIMTGDEDWPCLEPALLMKRTIPSAPCRNAKRRSYDKSGRSRHFQPAYRRISA